jgi:broad specificity phosphatase PhoE
MSFYLLRHAQKEKGDYHNPLLKHQDEPLSNNGQRQAMAIARYFEDLDIAAVYVSTYIRTFQTIRPLTDIKQITPATDHRLDEIDNGYIDEMSEMEFKKAYPDIWKQYAARTSDFRFPGGETGQEVRARISEFLREKLDIHGKENVIMVSHDGLIRVCMTYLLDIPVYKRGDFKVDLCGLTQFEFQEDVKRWKLLSFNQTITLSS